MSSVKKISLFTGLALLGSITRVSAHGFISGIVIDGQYYPGFNPGAAPYQHPPPPVIGWPNGASDTGFVSPSAFSGGDIVCHLSSRPGEKHATIAAGSSIDLQWNQWPESHHGPVLDYLAKCDGECEQADKLALKFFKIDEAGLINGSPAPGKWASDNLIANNNTWRVTIPASVAPGNYVLRHEIIALHSADKADGAQNYPQCINLEVTGSGTDNPAGIPATQFYTPTDPGIFVSIYYPALTNYTIPGPPLFSGATPGSSSLPPAPASSAPASSIPASSAAPTAYESPSAPATSGPKPSSAVNGTGATPPAYVPTSAASLPEPTITSGVLYASAVPPTDEQTSTTTTDTTTTLTTTVEPGSTPTDVVPSDPLPTENKAAEPTDGPDVLPTPSQSGYGEPAPEPTESAVEPTDVPDSIPTPTEAGDGEPAPTSTQPVVSASLIPSQSAIPPTPVDNSTIIFPTPTPTPSAPADSPGKGDGLPSGASWQEFVTWLKKALQKFFAGAGHGGKHARDLGV